LEGFGDRVQGSVFELAVDRELLERCIDMVAEEIAPDEDRISFYRLCAACERERLYLGRTDGTDAIGEEDVFIVRPGVVAFRSRKHIGGSRIMGKI